MEITDVELINKYLKKGDEKSLEEIVRRYLPVVFNLSRRYVGRTEDAADIAQETFVKVWKNINKFDLTKSFKSWILTIARNTAIDWLRKNKDIPVSVYQTNQEYENTEDMLVSIPDSTPSALEWMFRSELKQNLETGLNQLPTFYRSVIKLRHEEDLSFKEIAARLKEPLNTIKSRYRRGLARLKGIIKPL